MCLCGGGGGGSACTVLCAPLGNPVPPPPPPSSSPPPTTPRQVWVKVLSVQPDARGEPRVSCSMRAVGQDDGTDLDPDNALAAAGEGVGERVEWPG